MRRDGFLYDKPRSIEEAASGLAMVHDFATKGQVPEALLRVDTYKRLLGDYRKGVIRFGKYSRAVLKNPQVAELVLVGRGNPEKTESRDVVATELLDVPYASLAVCLRKIGESEYDLFLTLGLSSKRATDYRGRLGDENWVKDRVETDFPSPVKNPAWRMTTLLDDNWCRRIQAQRKFYPEDLLSEFDILEPFVKGMTNLSKEVEGHIRSQTITVWEGERLRGVMGALVQANRLVGQSLKGSPAPKS